MRATKPLFGTALACTIVAIASAAPPEGKGGGKGGGGDDEATVEVPTTVFIESQRRSAPRLVIAGSDSSNNQMVYQYANYAAYLHDAVLVEEGHGRALLTDRAENPLPLILVDFWFDAEGNLINSTSRVLVVRTDWGCETFSSDGTRAIYFDRNNSQVNSIDLANNNVTGIVFSDPSEGFASCDFQSDDPMNGVLHATVHGAAGARIERFDLSSMSQGTVYGPTSSDIRDFSIHYDGSQVSRVAISEDYTIRFGTSFANASNASVAVSNGTEADFYCDGQQLLFKGRQKNKRTTQVYDLQSRSSVTYDNEANPSPRTLC